MTVQLNGSGLKTAGFNAVYLLQHAPKSNGLNIVVAHLKALGRNGIRA
jgi:hypothetical protein